MFFDRKDDIYFVKWAQAVKKRDHYICVICNRRGVELNAHHMNSWDVFVEERYDLENGVTLCSICHNSFHNIYGYGKNTMDQFKEFKSICSIMYKTGEEQVKIANLTNLLIKKLETDGYAQQPNI